MNIWKRYGWHSGRPWWKGDGVTNSLTRTDGAFISSHNRSFPLVLLSLQEVREQAEEYDRENPLPCPPVAVGQVWYFPKADKECLVVHRLKGAYLMTDGDLTVLDTMDNEEHQTASTDEYSSVPPYDGEPGWLVYGPGAPWAPMRDEP